MSKRKIRISTVIILVIALLLGIFSVFEVTQNYQLKKDTQNFSSQISQLTDNNKKLNDALSSQKSENEKLKKQIETFSSSSAITGTSVTASKGQKVAYLTFDDGPSDLTPGLLDILKKNDVKATFFVVADGEDTPSKRSIMKRIVSEGHTIGIHSYTHKYKYIYANEKNYFDDFNKMENIVKEATGVTPKFMRFPGGTNNTISFRYHGGTPIMPTLLNEIKERGYTAVDWNAGGMDAVNPVPPTSTITRGVISECEQRCKVIILLHDSGTHATSIQAVPIIIAKLKSEGYTFKAITTPDEAFTTKPALKK